MINTTPPAFGPQNLIPQNRLGMGCWAIGGPFFAGTYPLGYGSTDDAQSLATLEAAYEAGIRLFDTAAAYGCGHSERLLGEAFRGTGDVVISTKFGFGLDPATKQLTGEERDPSMVRQALDGSRKRLRRDRLDLVFLHLNALPVDEAAPLFDALEEARADGVIGAYGWSTDFPANAAAMAPREGFVAVQHAMNLFFNAPSMIDVAQTHGLAAFNRSPLAMGVLTGKFTAGQAMANDDVRHNSFDWMDYFKDGVVAPDFVARLDAVRALLTVDGRSLAQGALSWLWAASPVTVPIPGARTVQQARHNTEALTFGPLPEAIMAEIEDVLDRPPEGPPRER